MAIALLTTYLADYRLPLYERLARRHEIEVLCFGGGERYVPPWFADLDAQLRTAPFPARRIDGVPAAFAAARRHDAVIVPYAGGALLPAAYAGARTSRRPVVLWASVWAQPRSLAHAVSLPVIRHIYRHADAVVAYGEHVRRFVAAIRGRDDDIFVAPQSVEAELFGGPVGEEERARWRAVHGLPADAPLVLYVGRLVPEKGVDVLVRAAQGAPWTLVLVGEGPLGASAGAAGPNVRVLPALARSELPVAYASAQALVLPSVPTPRFREPWGLVCNEAMHAGCPVVASSAVGAVAGGLVRDRETGLVVPFGDPRALRGAIDDLLGDPVLAQRLANAGRAAVAAYNYDAMAAGFDAALAWALR